MSGGAQDQAVRTGRIARTFIYVVLIYFALFYLLPLFVMAINSLKPLSEITGGNMMSLPVDPTLAPWASAWSTAQIGVEATGLKPFFLNSILMVVPAVVIGTIVGALMIGMINNGLILMGLEFSQQLIAKGAIIILAVALSQKRG